MKLLTSVFFLILSITVSAQQEANTWCFGYGIGLDFKTSPPDTFRTAKTFYTLEGAASMSDSTGKLLFYTNGDSVWNSDHVVMDNGFGIGVSTDPLLLSSSQAALIVPKPGSDKEYYIFTTDDAEHDLKSGFRYSIVDMSLNNGKGRVTSKGIKLIDKVLEKQTAIVHDNCDDIWIITHGYDSDAFYAFQLSETGLNTTPVVSHSGQVQTGSDKIPFDGGTTNYSPESMAKGYMQSSPNGKKIVVLPFTDHHKYPGRVEVFSFDNASGQVSLDFTVEDEDSFTYYGASFSPNSQYLYVSAGWHGLYLHQYSMNTTNSADFIKSRVVIHELPAVSKPAIFGGMSLGIDGQLYISTGKQWLDVVQFPNVGGLRSTFRTQYVHLPSFSGHSAPNFMQSYFLPEWEDSCLSKNNRDTSITVSNHFYIPSAFSPNDNDLNDLFSYVGDISGGARLQIFNMWGEKLYDKEDAHPAWDGYYLNQLCPAGPYLYILNFKDDKNLDVQKHGTVVLFR